jgi:hypothetical protein
MSEGNTHASKRANVEQHANRFHVVELIKYMKRVIKTETITVFYAQLCNKLNKNIDVILFHRYPYPTILYQVMSNLAYIKDNYTLGIMAACVNHENPLKTGVKCT